MKYSAQELDWIETEWSLATKGRMAAFSREDFAVLCRWEADQVPADQVVKAIQAFGKRLAQRPRRPQAPRLAWAGEDLARVQAGQPVRDSRIQNDDPWDASVQAPLRHLPQAKAAWTKWRALKAVKLHADAPGYLDHQDATKAALKDLLHHAEALLGERAEPLRAKAKEASQGFPILYHLHLAQALRAAWGIPE